MRLSKTSLVVLPDTQEYSASYPSIFTFQTEWIVNQLQGRNIVFVTHEGDIVDRSGDLAQWDNANVSMSKLDGNVPYGVLPGNHDGGESKVTTKYNKYFPVSRYDGYSWYGGNYPADKNDNSYQLFSAGEDDYIMVHLIFLPTSDVIQWANLVLQSYPNRKAIITTHGYLNITAERSVHTSSGSSSTQYIWDELIYPNSNIFLVLCGHSRGEARRTDGNVAGKPVHQLLADYQSRTNGGNGWLRIMKFVSSQDRIYVDTYSPYIDQYETDADSQFALGFDMGDSTETGTGSGVPVSETQYFHVAFVIILSVAVVATAVLATKQKKEISSL